jgi:hypothetical protein
VYESKEERLKKFSFATTTNPSQWKAQKNKQHWLRQAMVAMQHHKERVVEKKREEEERFFQELCDEQQAAATAMPVPRKKTQQLRDHQDCFGTTSACKGTWSGMACKRGHSTCPQCTCRYVSPSLPPSAPDPQCAQV